MNEHVNILIELVLGKLLDLRKELENANEQYPSDASSGYTTINEIADLEAALAWLRSLQDQETQR